MPTESTVIEVDIDVYRAIEARRTSFAETHNTILRKALGIREPYNPHSDHLNTNSQPKESAERVRRSGMYRVFISGKWIEESHLKDAYRESLLCLSHNDPSFLQKLSERRTRARRLVARKPEALFLSTPELAKDHAERLVGEWWFDVNLSQDQVVSRLKMAAEVAGFGFGEELRVDFPE